MPKGLPIKLAKEPLLEAVFEVRFISKTPASVILPSFLFNNLEGDKNIEQLPIAQLPKHARDSDLQLKFLPLIRIEWGHFYINIGDSSVSVSCKHPYPGWGAFKPVISKVVDILAESKIVESIQRYSMKYVDMIQSSDDKQKVSMINCNLSIAGHELEKEPFLFRIEIPRDGFINAVQVVSTAQAVVNSVTMEGLIVDVDTFSHQSDISVDVLVSDLQEKLESIHQTNKAVFFSCLTEQTITLLEPVYAK